MLSKSNIILIAVVASVVTVVILNNRKDKEEFDNSPVEETPEPTIVGYLDSENVDHVLDNWNGQELFDWISGYGVDAEYIPKLDPDNETVKDRIRIKVAGKGWRVANVGDFIVKRPDNTFYIVKEEDAN
jgi:hypothetical protein